MSIVRPICRPLTRPLTRAIGEAGGGGVTPADAFAASVAFIGDSRIYDSEYEWRNVGWSDAKGIPLSVGFCTGQGITAESVGGATLEYRASDAHIRWTAPGDTAGPWTAMFPGWNILESGTAGKGARIGVRTLSGLPGTDQTVTVSVTGAPQNGWKSNGFGSRAMNFMYWLNAAPKFLGLGGSTTAQVIDQLPWLETQAGGIGYDIFQLSTNDISGSTALATIEANLTQIYDARRALGRRLVLVGEPARWGVNTSTPLTVGQQAILDGVNAFMATYAAANGCIFVDAYALTFDSGFSDRRPKAGVLRDTLHYSDIGAQVVGEAVADAIAAFTGRGQKRAEGSAGNIMTEGYMAGTSGTVGTGFTGTAPTGWNIRRVSGSDATGTAAVSNRTDGVAGRWFEINFSATSGAQVIEASGINRTLATAGLAVGDTIYIESEFDISGVSGGLVECDAFVQFAGTSPLCNVRAQIFANTSSRQANEASVRRSPNMVIPVGTTNVRFFLWIRTQDSASALVKLASCAIVKVS